MNVVRTIKSVIILFALVGQASALHAQKCVLIDKLTGEPIVHASLYCKENGKFKSAISNDRGVATVDFAFKKLTISHLNYEKITVTKLADTIRLTPRDYETAEVLVQEREPEWIKRKLRQVVKEKDRHYFTRSDTLSYSYDTQSIGNRSFYHFTSEGFLGMKSKENKHFSFLQRQGTITASDSTRLTDVVNLRRMLHEDFVSDLDNTFVRTHRFAVNEEYEGDPGVVELAYRSTKHDKDHGRIVVDTLHNIIRSASRISGKDCNQSLRTSAFMLTTARLLSGYVIRVWDVDYRVTYTEHQGNWLPSEVRYKFYFKNTESRPEKLESEFNKKTGGGFANMEATLSLKYDSTAVIPAPIAAPKANTDSTQVPTWKEIPKSWYLKFNSDAERAYEIELSHMPATFRLMDEERE